MSSLAFQDVVVRYDRHVAVQPFTDSVRPGEWLCLIGPNGAGKSSVLRAVAGLVGHEGTITVDGAPLAVRSPRRRAALAVNGEVVVEGKIPGPDEIKPLLA